MDFSPIDKSCGVHKAISALGFPVGNSSRVPFAKEEAKQLDQRITELSKRLPSDRRKRLGAAQNRRTFDSEINELLQDFGYNLWGKNVPRDHLVSAGIDPYPEDLYYPEHGDELKKRLNQWIYSRAGSMRNEKKPDARTSSFTGSSNQSTIPAGSEQSPFAPLSASDQMSARSGGSRSCDARGGQESNDSPLRKPSNESCSTPQPEVQGRYAGKRSLNSTMLTQSPTSACKGRSGTTDSESDDSDDESLVLQDAENFKGPNDDTTMDTLVGLKYVPTDQQDDGDLVDTPQSSVTDDPGGLDDHGPRHKALQRETEPNIHTRESLSEEQPKRGQKTTMSDAFTGLELLGSQLRKRKGSENEEVASNKIQKSAATHVRQSEQNIFFKHILAKVTKQFIDSQDSPSDINYNPTRGQDTSPEPSTEEVMSRISSKSAQSPIDTFPSQDPSTPSIDITDEDDEDDVRDELIDIMMVLFSKDPIEISSCTLEQAEEVWLLESRHDHLLRRLRELTAGASDGSVDHCAEYKDRDRALNIWISMRDMLRKQRLQIIKRRQSQRENSVDIPSDKGDLLLQREKAQLRRAWRRLGSRTDISGDDYISDIISELVRASQATLSRVALEIKRKNSDIFRSCLDL
ncbi:hypothetical protein AOQ84DRAFT_358034 [Glonium stellatum]|uniref:Uncharacterized protein n=1 Tax=Glonium stellatum TaxID=574774 RepID=A0A8E2FDZ9_9PEZI|nr:hypothetical protein AOQ84DRAFT_358034 [Glonium stellatum]